MQILHPSRCTAKHPENFSEYHIAEPKVDGSRYLFYIGDDPTGRRSGNTLLSRHLSVVDDFPVDKTDNVLFSKKHYENLSGTVLDGEIFRKDFSYTQSILLSSSATAKEKQQSLPLHYFVFDVLFFKGIDVRSKDLAFRQKILKTIVSKMDSPLIKILPQYAHEQINSVFLKIVGAGGEGLVVKDIRLSYGVGWSKMKKSYDVSCIISGFKIGTGKYSDQIGSIKLSVIDGDILRTVGFASGFDDNLRLDMSKNPKKYLGKVVDIFAHEISRDNRLRHPTFYRMRPDLSAKEITLEKLKNDLKKNVKKRRIK